MSGHDVVFLGSSPNALAAAARLARAGRRVLVLEARPVVGGPVATESFAPGFRADTGVTSAALDPEVASELGVTLEPIRRDTVSALGGSTGPVTLRGGEAGLPRAVTDAVDLLRAIHRTGPPAMPVPLAGDAAALDELGARLTGLGQRGMHEVLRLLFMPARDFVNEAVASEAERAVLCGVAVRGLSEGPFAPGTLFGLLHHMALEDGLSRLSAKGGVQALAEALATVARSAGAEIRVGMGRMATVELEAGVARGVRLPDGARIDAAAVVSDHDLRTTFTRLVPPRELDPEVNRAVRAVRYRGSVARVHLALRALPRFTGLDADALRGTLVTAASVASIERAWDEGKRGAPSSRPYIEATLPTLADPSLAPEGHHVLDAWVQYVPYRRADRAQVLRSVVATLEASAPGLGELVLHHHVSLPEDLEERFGLTEGNLHGGEVRLEQAFFLRPLPGWSSYQTPIPNLYMGGSAAHPGGYSGRSGWNLAAVLLSGAT